jgi:hypothetical protein
LLCISDGQSIYSSPARRVLSARALEALDDAVDRRGEQLGAARGGRP